MVIIIIAVVLGGFFLYPIILNAPGNTTGDDGPRLTSGTTVTPATTVKNTGTYPTPTHLPTENPNYYGGPGNSPANVGL